MKAIVWSVTVQISLMSASMTVLVIKEVVDVGIVIIWNRNLNLGRLEILKQGESVLSNSFVIY